MKRRTSKTLLILVPIAILSAGCSDSVWLLEKKADPPIPPEMPVKPVPGVPKPADTTYWSRELGAELATSIFRDHTADADGNVILVGTITGPVEFQGAQIPCACEKEGMVED